MFGVVLAHVNIVIVLHQHVNVVEHEAVELSAALLRMAVSLVVGGDLLERRVHYLRLVETSVVELFGHEDAVHHFLPLVGLSIGLLFYFYFYKISFCLHQESKVCSSMI